MMKLRWKPQMLEPESGLLLLGMLPWLFELESVELEFPDSWEELESLIPELDSEFGSMVMLVMLRVSWVSQGACRVLSGAPTKNEV